LAFVYTKKKSDAKKHCITIIVYKAYKTAAYKHGMGVVEHERSLRGTQGIAECFSDFLSALQLPECLHHHI
jgi:hypothetical protein